MPDREKVISGLQYTIEMFLFDPATGHSKDPDDLNDADRITYDACIGAIAMLKEQEPVPSGKRIKAGDVALNFFECGYCKNAIRKPWRYCPFCGKAVKWNGFD